MKRLHYHRVDVFTDRAFGGNPLAVFTEAAGIPDGLMQMIAKELNLSETTFVSAPADKDHDCRVRIFTPTSELPMAGHPTIGTAFVLARDGVLKKPNVVFEEGVGPVPVAIKIENGMPGFIEMRQPLPEFGSRFEDVKSIAQMLSIEPGEISDTKLPMEVISCGVPILIVPINSLETMSRIRFRLDIWDKLLRGSAAENIFAFAKGGRFAGSAVHSRMFVPAYGIAEDPATGGATGPLGCYLVRNRVFPSDGELRCVSEQGVEMGRPSFLHFRIAHDEDAVTGVYVGGRCHSMGSGYFEIAELS